MPRKYVRKPRARRPKPLAGKKGVRSAIRKQSTKVFNSRVKQAVKQLMEVKQSGIRGTIQIVNFNGTNAVNCDAINQIAFDPIINQGTGERDRIGNCIDVVSCKMRYMITVNSTDFATTVPTWIRLIWYYDRADTNNLPTPYQNANFIDNGNSSSGFAGDLTDIFYRYNTDRYRILGVRDHKLGFASSTGTSPQPQFQYFANNDSKMIVRGTVDCTKWIIKRQKFNDNLGTAEGRKLYCLILCMAQSGAIWASISPTNRMRYEVNYKYTDA